MLADVWEPVFGNGSRPILDSGLARSLPAPDAAPGAAGYLVFAQLVVYRHYCTLCLCSAAISLVVAGPVSEEVAAVRRVHHECALGRSLWQALHGEHGRLALAGAAVAGAAGAALWGRKR